MPITITHEERATKRLKTIATINGRLKPPTEGELKSLSERHCESWGEYICTEAENAGVHVNVAYNLFQMLGEDEAFDGFVTHLEDAGEEGEEG